MYNLYLIPNLLGETEVNKVLPAYVQEVISNLRCFFVENVRTARRFLRKVDKIFPIDDSTFYEIGKHSDIQQITGYFSDLNCDAGIISESGMPAIADPGASIVMIARQKNFKIVPLVGPSSILLSLTASGLNGQNFTFHGYLPVEKNVLINKIKEIERNSQKLNQTQIFIEAPYRNISLFQNLVNTCNNSTLLCIAKEITTDEEEIITQSIFNWKRQTPDINKKNTIFLLHSV